MVGALAGFAQAEVAVFDDGVELFEMGAGDGMPDVLVLGGGDDGGDGVEPVFCAAFFGGLPEADDELEGLVLVGDIELA